MDPAVAEIDRILRRQHRIAPGQPSDFNVRNQASLLSTFEETTRTFTFLLAGIALISLLVGGIGIMNIMLVSVTERTREIGVRKALGARRRHILLQFLIESVVLCMAGGTLGSRPLGGAARPCSRRAAGWETAVAPEAVASRSPSPRSWESSSASGPPAGRPKLDPIESLRYE
jgi:putative ABC transport system permease protein